MCPHSQKNLITADLALSVDPFPGWKVIVNEVEVAVIPQSPKNVILASDPFPDDLIPPGV